MDTLLLTSKLALTAEMDRLQALKFVMTSIVIHVLLVKMATLYTLLQTKFVVFVTMDFSIQLKPANLKTILIVTLIVKLAKTGTQEVLMINVSFAAMELYNQLKPVSLQETQDALQIVNPAKMDMACQQSQANAFIVETQSFQQTKFVILQETQTANNANPVQINTLSEMENADSVEIVLSSKELKPVIKLTPDVLTANAKMDTHQLIALANFAEMD